MTAEQDRRMIAALERGMPAALASRAVYGQGEPETVRAVGIVVDADGTHRRVEVDVPPGPIADAIREGTLSGLSLDLGPRRHAEQVARAFHEAYERLAPAHGYRTREASAVPWGDVPEANRALMVATVDDLLRRAVILPGTRLDLERP